MQKNGMGVSDLSLPRLRLLPYPSMSSVGSVGPRILGSQPSHGRPHLAAILEPLRQTQPVSQSDRRRNSWRAGGGLPSRSLLISGHRNGRLRLCPSSCISEERRDGKNYNIATDVSLFSISSSAALFL